MSSTLQYRIAAVLLVLFAAGHTAGFLQFVPPSAEGVAVRDSMQRVEFDFDGKKHSYGGFYTGFGLTVTALLLFSAIVAWNLSTLARTTPQAIGVIGWSLCVCQLVVCLLSWHYFFLPPTLLSGLAAIATGWATWRASAGEILVHSPSDLPDDA
jgi:hypothetical protein